MVEIVQIVRRAGPVGGMEEYAWQLITHLVNKGRQVRILCESCEQDVPTGVIVEKLPTIDRGPRWLRQRRFSKSVENWWSENKRSGLILHSHEHVTTADVLSFHSTLHGWGERKWYKKFDPTWHFNKQFEQQIIFAKHLKHLVPVSGILFQQIKDYYGNCAGKLSGPISPGVCEPIRLSNQISTSRPMAIGFMGREWKRKGLLEVIKIFRHLIENDSTLQLIVAGVPEDEISPLIYGIEPKVQNLGWINDKENFYSHVDLLIHPARLEAFGMVVTEALARGTKVLISDQVGALSEIPDGHGCVMPNDCETEEWAACARKLLSKPAISKPYYSRGWGRVAEDYNAIYKGFERVIR